MDLPVVGLCINPFPPRQKIKKFSFARLVAKHEYSGMEANLPTYRCEERMLIISPSMGRSVGYDMNKVRDTEYAIPTMYCLENWYA